MHLILGELTKPHGQLGKRVDFLERLKGNTGLERCAELPSASLTHWDKVSHLSYLSSFWGVLHLTSPPTHFGLPTSGNFSTSSLITTIPDGKCSNGSPSCMAYIVNPWRCNDSTSAFTGIWSVASIPVANMNWI